MRKIHVCSFITMLCLILACDGEFVKDELAIFLSFPKNNEPCLDGEKLDEKLSIPFKWSFEGLPNNLSIQLDKLDSNKEIINQSEQVHIPISVEEISKDIVVDPGSWYQWQILGNDGTLRSDIYTFYSQGPPSINHAPLPAQINIIRNNNTQVEFNWTQTPDPDNDRLVFDVSFGETQEASLPLASELGEPTEISLSPIQANKTYYIKVVTKEIRSDNTSGNKSIALLKVVVNG